MSDTRQKIIESALQLFGQTGYTATTTREIAEQAGVNEVTIFRHFGNKKNLLIACIQASNERGFAQSFEEHLTGDYATDIRMMADMQMTSTEEGFETLRLIMCDSQAVPELKEALLAGATDNLAHLENYFQSQIDAGTVQTTATAEVLSHAFDSLFSSYVFFQSMMGSPPVSGTSRDEMLDALTNIFIRGTQSK